MGTTQTPQLKEQKNGAQRRVFACAGVRGGGVLHLGLCGEGSLYFYDVLGHLLVGLLGDAAFYFRFFLVLGGYLFGVALGKGFFMVVFLDSMSIVGGARLALVF